MENKLRGEITQGFQSQDSNPCLILKHRFITRALLEYRVLRSSCMDTDSGAWSFPKVRKVGQ